MSVQRINFTQRSRLTREQANITIHPDGEDRPASFEARLNLSDLREAAGDARVFVEAYHQTTRMRFDFGTVAAITAPTAPELRLAEFPDWKDVRFRVKVTDVDGTPGKLIAWADRIKPQGPDDQDEPDLVRFLDAELFGLLWDLDFDEQGPVVRIEKKHNAQDVGRDPVFQSAVFPEVMRRTLEYAFIEEQVPYPNPGHWSTLWVDGFIKAKLGLKSPPATDGSEEADVRRWIRGAVETFARQHRIADLWGQAHEETT